MFFLANLYERRLNDNMRRHMLSANLAPVKPRVAPSRSGAHRCPSFPTNNKVVDEEILNRFLNVRDTAKSEASLCPVSPPAYQEAVQKADHYECKQSAHFKADELCDSPPQRARAGSVESALFTDSDAASNSSFSA